jgi:hypothetical protein
MLSKSWNLPYIDPKIFVGERAPTKDVSYERTLEAYWQSLLILSFLKGNSVKFLS